MPSLDELCIDKAIVQRMYDEWCDGAKKSQLERKHLNKPESQGKLFTALVRDHLGVETERQSALPRRVGELEAENRRLRELLHEHGINPSGS